MDINLSLSPATGITSNYLVVAVYNATAPAAVVAFQAFPAPHVSPQDVTFTNLDEGVYIVITYESPDGLADGIVRHQFIYDPTWANAVTRVDQVIICGSTTGFDDGATGFSDPTWVGWTISLERRAKGSTMVDQAISTVDAEIIFRPAGGFDLVDPTDAFVAGEIVIAHFQPQITTGNPPVNPTAGVIWKQELDIAVDTTLDSTAMASYCIIAGTNPTVNITLPPISTVPDGKMIGFLSDGGNHIIANLLPAGGDQIKWLNDFYTNSDPLGICQGEIIWIASYNGAWRVHSAFGGFSHVGEFVETLGMNNLNMLQLDGSVVSRAQYPRLWRWVNKKLDGTMLITDTQWNLQNTTGGSAQFKMYPNCGRFSMGDGSTTFRLPLFVQKKDTLVPQNVMAGGFRRAVPGANGAAGVLSRDKVGNFGATIQGRIIAKSGTSNQVTVLSAGPTDADKGPNNVTLPFSGTDINTGLVNGETTPFYTTNYLFIRF